MHLKKQTTLVDDYEKFDTEHDFKRVALTISSEHVLCLVSPGIGTY